MTRIELLTHRTKLRTAEEHVALVTERAGAAPVAATFYPGSVELLFDAERPARRTVAMYGRRVAYLTEPRHRSDGLWAVEVW